MTAPVGMSSSFTGGGDCRRLLFIEEPLFSGMLELLWKDCSFNVPLVCAAGERRDFVR